MTSAHRFLSLSILGVMALAVAPLAGAQGLGQDLDRNQRQELRAELKACRDDNESHEDKRACAEAVFENAGVERPERGPRGNNERRGDREELPEGAREALKACHENNDEHEDKKACAEAVADQYDFELPERGLKMNKGRKVGHMFRANITETCGERTDTDEWKTCAKEARTESIQELREEHPRATRRFTMRRRFKGLDEDGRDALKACRQLETRDEKKACFDNVRDNLDTE